MKILIFILYLCLSLIATYPIIFNLDDAQVIGDSSHPGLQGEFVLAHAIFKSKSLKFNFSSYFNYPFGQDIKHISSTSLHLFIYIFLTKIFNQVQSYNILIILTITLNAFSMYLLARYLIKDGLVSFVVGIFFAFSTYPFFKLSMGFLQKGIMFWIPLYLLCLFKTFEQNRARINFMFMVSLLYIMLITYPPYVLMAAIFTFLYLSHKIKNNWMFNDTIMISLLCLVLVGIVLYLNRVLNIAPFIKMPELSQGNLDITNVFKFYPFKGMGEGYPDDIPLGLSFLIFVVSTIAFFRTKGFPKFIFLIGIIFLLFSMGPFLSSNGEIRRLNGHKILLPYYLLLKYVPFAYRINFPIRFFPFIYVCFSITAGFGLKVILRSIKRKKFFLICLVIILYLVECYSLYGELFPLKVSQISMPQFYETLKKDSEKSAILMLPWNIDNKNLYLFIGTMIDRKTVNALYRAPDIYIPKDSDDLAVKREFFNTLAGSGVRYVILHMNFFDEHNTDRFGWLEDFCIKKTLYEEDELFVFEISPKNNYYIVPDDYKSIQEAIEAFTGKGTIVVRPGRYKENIDFLGKPVYLKSLSGPEATIIDGDFKGPVVKFIAGENRDSGIEGFTIINGTGWLETKYFNKNQGGGIYCRESGPLIKNNIIKNNKAENGGGVLCHNSLFIQPIIISNLIKDNEAVKGGGIRCSDSSPIIANNIIIQNKASRLGGGIYWRQSSMPLIVNNTIVDNSAGEYGGGIFGSNYVSPEKEPTISNSILWGNYALRGSQIALNLPATRLTIDSSIIQNGKADILMMRKGIILNYLSTNITKEPNIGDLDSGTLQDNSPCIDKGNNEYIRANNIEIDFNNQSRVVDGDHDGRPVVDIGACEFEGHSDS